MRPYRKRFRLSRPEATIRRFDGGREVCLSTQRGKAEYQQRKQRLWEMQKGICAHCGEMMSLLETRTTRGDWEPTGQVRDDRITAKDGKVINHLVHKNCLRSWHNENDGISGEEE